MTENNKNNNDANNNNDATKDVSADNDHNLNFTAPEIDELIDNIAINEELDDKELDDGSDDAAIQYRLAELEFELTAEKMREQEQQQQPVDAIVPTDEDNEQSESENSDNKELDNVTTKELLLDDVDKDDTLECLNCATPLNGPYCHNCGQPDRHFIRFFPKVLWDMINEAFDLDSRAFRTLIPLFFQPGRLSMEYIAGRRARYVNPLRLYIILSVLFFISVTVLTNSDNNFTVTDSNGVNVRVRSSDDATGENEKAVVDPVVEQRQVVDILKAKQAEGLPITDEAIAEAEAIVTDLEQNPEKSKQLKTGKNDDDELDVVLDNGEQWDVDKNPMQFSGIFDAETTHELNQFLWAMRIKLEKTLKEDPSKLMDEFLNRVPQLMFILLPIFALLLKITYILKKRYYMEHIIVALHSHCFIFFSLIILLLLSNLHDVITDPPWLVDLLQYAAIATGIWIPINIFITQKRIYAQGYIMTSLKYIFVGMSYIVLLSFTAASAFVLGLATL